MSAFLKCDEDAVICVDCSTVYHENDDQSRFFRVACVDAKKVWTRKNYFVIQVLLYGRGYWKTSSQIKRKLEETDVVLQKDAQSTMEGGM